MTTEEFIKNVRRQASIPVSQVTFETSDFLDLAQGEMQTYLLPFMDRIKEEFFLWDDDQAYVAGASYRMHYRAAGCTLRDVLLVVGDKEVSLDRVSFDQHEKRYAGYYVRGQRIHLIPVVTAPSKIRMVYMARPNRLVVAASATTVTAKNATTVTLAGTPSGFASPLTFDVVKGKEPFDFVGIDRAGTLSGGVITITDGLGTDDISVGDYIALPGQSPVVMLPEPAAWLLVQQVAVRCLEALGDGDGMTAAVNTRQQMEASVAQLLGNRVKGDPQQVVATDHPLWRMS